MGRHDDDLLLIKLAAVKVAPAVHSRMVKRSLFVSPRHPRRLEAQASSSLHRNRPSQMADVVSTASVESGATDDDDDAVCLHISLGYESLHFLNHRVFSCPPCIGVHPC